MELQAAETAGYLPPATTMDNLRKDKSRPCCSCKVCSCQFTRPSSLKRHVTKQHPASLLPQQPNGLFAAPKPEEGNLLASVCTSLGSPLGDVGLPNPVASLLVHQQVDWTGQQEKEEGELSDSSEEEVEPEWDCQKVDSIPQSLEQREEPEQLEGQWEEHPRTNWRRTFPHLQGDVQQQPQPQPPMQQRMGVYFRAEPMDAREQAAFEAFKSYILSDMGGGCSTTTCDLYSGKMRHFLQHCRQERGIPAASFWFLANLGCGTVSASDGWEVPDLEPFLSAACISNFVRKNSVCAYIKLLHWLKDAVLKEAVHSLPPDLYSKRNWQLQSELATSDLILRSLNKKGCRASRGVTNRASANAEDSPSLAMLEGYFKDYMESPLRRAMVEASQDVLVGYAMGGVAIGGRRERSIIYLRNFLILELLVRNGEFCFVA